MCSLLHEGSWPLIDACKLLSSSSKVVLADAVDGLIALLWAGESGRAHLDLLLSSNILCDSGGEGITQDPGLGWEGFM